jgi:hypothetical protein
MEFNYDLINQNLIIYQEALTDIEIFDLKYPDNKDGHNALVKIAERKYQRLRAVSDKLYFLELVPVPPKK